MLGGNSANELGCITVWEDMAINLNSMKLLPIPLIKNISNATGDTD